MQEFSQRVIAIISRVPFGRVATYGQIASIAGRPRGARQVARILHSCSDKYGLPWHRVINARGVVSLSGILGAKQRQKLRSEAIEISPGDRIDLTVYQWKSNWDD